METQALDNEILTDTSENITFTPLEWKYFVLELKSMIANGEFNLPKVINNAKFYAEIERRTKDIKAGRYIEFTSEEWEKFVNEQNLS